ncbi:hypothetical protein GCM10011344_10170 [Dokdonia pacifica]|uniref:Glycosyltransferase involved in cell wall bisynthesis n=1 Tax=Dokdonia pacifica TaxID=1627892 RepID=A0A238YNG0_9FLAO|nr:glycosyltransferase family 2 protein [Dokdonia pacifica]GGG11422.1 hypothetical protein GCM10011344_10170 [Dokdonia pacifica]SNR71969.1 Glycosyltransferase involved in cell wall bisynthesis [Dokdonia pacifica]
MSFSIIVPVYFYNEYVKGMLISLLNQTFKDFELVVVGNSISETAFKEIKASMETVINGSIDCKFIHTEEKGANNARKLGFSTSTKPYVFFIDSDDQINDTSSFDRIITLLKKTPIDIISLNLENATYVNDKYTSKNTVYNFQKPNKLLDINIDYKTIINNFGTNICARFINRELLEGVHFLDLPYSQDWNISCKIFPKATTFLFVSNPEYGWVYRENSISRKSSMSKQKHEDSFNSITDIVSFFEENNFDKDYKLFLNKRIVEFSLQYIIRGKDYDFKKAIKRSQALLKKSFSYSSDTLKDKKTMVMYMMIRVPVLLKMYLKYKKIS